MLPFSLRQGKVKIMSPQENDMVVLGQIVKQIPKKLIEKRFRKGYLAQIRDCIPPGRSGEIVVFDKAYVDFAHLNHFEQAGGVPGNTVKRKSLLLFFEKLWDSCDFFLKLCSGFFSCLTQNGCHRNRQAGGSPVWEWAAR